MSLYVVEINVPTAGFMPIGDREEMESPAYFGTRRGYWRVYMGQDEVGNERPDGVQAILELDAGSAEEAEDLAEAAGRKLSAFFATYLGSPLTTPRISKLAEIGASGGIVEQRSYHYEAPKSGWPQVKITPPRPY